MSSFAFSSQTLEDLERVQGASGSGRGRTDRRGNSQFGRAFLGVAGGRSDKPKDGGLAARSAAANARLDRAAKRTPQVVVKITSRTHGGGGTVGAMTYAGRVGMSEKEPIGIETSEGKHLIDARDMLELAREWDQWEHSDSARRQGATAIAMVFSMPPGTDPEMVREAVKEFAETDMADRRWAMALHTDEAHPHVHLIVANRDNDGRRFNPNRDFLQNCRERFAENLRALGVEADASIRMSRGYPAKQDSNPVLKMRERGAEPEADKGRKAMVAGSTPDATKQLAEREKARTKTAERFAMVREVYGRAIAELEAHGGADEVARAKSLRVFVEAMPEPVNARAEIIERLKAGNALGAQFAKDAELERLKARVKARENPIAVTPSDRIADALAKIKRASSDLTATSKAPSPTPVPGAPSDLSGRISDSLNTIKAASAELGNKQPTSAAPDKSQSLRDGIAKIKSAAAEQRERVKNASASSDAAATGQGNAVHQQPEQQRAPSEPEHAARLAATQAQLKAINERQLEKIRDKSRENDRLHDRDKDRDGPSR